MIYKPQIVVDLGFGDSGKGTIVDFLCSEYPKETPTPLVVRFSGGPQAAHNVVTSDGFHHTFSQFGSGSLLWADTFLSEHMLINPLNMILEASTLVTNTNVSSPFSRLHIAKGCPVITPFHCVLNQLREKHRDNPHGTCGQGVGETQQDLLDHPNEIIYAEDLLDIELTTSKLAFWQDTIKTRCEELFGETIPTENINEIAALYQIVLLQSNLVDNNYLSHFVLKKTGFMKPIIFEGSQGFLLDEQYGYDPHTTWSDVTSQKAFELIRKANEETYGPWWDFGGAKPIEGFRPEVIGVTRTYLTRHGAGPFIEDDVVRYEPHNNSTGIQGKFRTGPIYNLFLQAAASRNRVDHFAVTHMDKPGSYLRESLIPGGLKDIWNCYIDGYDSRRFVTSRKPADLWQMAGQLGFNYSDVAIISHGPGRSAKQRLGK